MAWTGAALLFTLVLIPYREAEAVFEDLRVHVMSLTQENAIDLPSVGRVP